MSTNYPEGRAGWFWVCIEKLEGGVIQGTMQNHYQQEPLPFRGLDQFFRLAQAAMDELNYPQSSARRHGFTGCGTQAKTQDEQLRLRREAEADGSGFHQKYGACAAFEVRIYCRANASWQGRAVFYHRKISGQLQFRSALELMLAIQDEVEKCSGEGRLRGRGEEKTRCAAV